MAERAVVIKLRAEIADYKRQMAEAAKATEGVGDKAKQSSEKATTGLGRMVQSASKHEQAWTQVGTSLLAMGTTAALGVGLAVSSFAEFDAQMSAVEASTRETTTNMGLLRDAAVDAGGATAFSATEAAQGIDELAKAGVSTADILDGGLTGALDLAAAGSLEVGAAAETAASAMTQFGLSGQDVPHIADLLAAAAGKAQGSVADMGAALGQAGLVANATGLSIEETTAGLAAFASAGLVGSDAGTSFKSMLQRLTPQSAEAQRAMDELGISAYDAQGNFIGLEAFAGNLQTAMADLTPEARNAAMAVIFGSDAVRASNVLYEQGADGIAEWTAKVNDAGYAAETAALMTNNLQGDLERLGGAFDTALIQSGSAANGTLRSLVQTATSAVDVFNGLPQGVQSSALGLTGMVGAAALAGGAFLVLTPRILETRRAVTQLKTDMPGATDALGKLGKAAAIAGSLYAVAAATSALVDALTTGEAEQGANAIAKGLRAVADGGDFSGINGQFDDFGKFLGMSVSRVNDLDSAFAQMSGNANVVDATTDSLARMLGQFPGITSYTEKVEARFAGLDTQLAGMVAGGSLEQAREAFHQIARQAEEQGLSIEEVTAMFPAYSDALIGAEEAQEAAGAATLGTVEAVEAQTDALGELVEALADASGVVASVMEAQAGLEAATDDATRAIGENGATLDITTEKGRANQTALLDIRDAGYELVTSMKANGATQAELQGAMATTRERFIAAATAMGKSSDEANRLADELGLIPSNVHVDVNAGGNASTVLDGIESKLARLTRGNGFTITTNLVTNEITRRSSNTLAPVARAWGGPVFGPGTETSDSIEARLSHNEHVWSAAEVKGAGGHAAVESLRARARMGALPGFAHGGSPGWTPTMAVAPAGFAMPNVYVENPFTGEYLLARVSTVAQREAVSTVRSSHERAR